MAFESATLETEAVGKLWLKELSQMQFLPGRSVGRRSGHLCVVTFTVRSGPTAYKTQAGYGVGIVPEEGWRQRWHDEEGLQELFSTPDLYVRALKNPYAYRSLLRQAGTWHNERINNGSKMMSKGFFGTSSSPSTATVGTPNRLAASNASGLTVTATDLSLGTITANSTTNEATTLGLARTGALTPGAVTDASALNGQLSFTLTNTFTASGGISIYGAGVADATTAAFNLFCEATHTAATLANTDTYTPTFTISN